MQDEEPWCGSDEELDRPDLDREWQRRHDQFHTKLYESAYSISTTDALKLFNESLTAKIAAEQSENAEIETSRAGLQEQRSEQNQLLNYAAELQSLVLKSPAVTLKSL
ncbi:hypothetical protein FEM48_Zijuj05G0031600 [Ziziphus jujuba var. spinosa]|uniref:Uncharacterized protein n=1 Tax=Ziziphus jujuba var. spinosa TaxID=714518 RepID=A0A978VCH1_ZIZJJ|nr:hypothetical protein FEM48_Zijuj05G0031600 [Ziziphus jujuba var. spinosa]